MVDNVRYNLSRASNSYTFLVRLKDTMTQTPGLRQRPQPSRPSYLAEVTLALISVWQNRASGRLSIRNSERFGLAHLYFREAILVHIAGDKGEGEAVLNNLLLWSKGTLRFDAAMRVKYESVTWQQAEIFTRWLSFLEMRGGMHDIPRTQIAGLTQHMAARLPKQPIELPEVVTRYEEFEEEALTRQWQLLGDGVDRMNQLIGHTEQVIRHTLAAEQSQQFIQSAKRTVESVRHTVSEIVEALPLPQVSPLTPQPQIHASPPPFTRGEQHER